jgi:signal transduction histidine kinase
LAVIATEVDAVNLYLVIPLISAIVSACFGAVTLLMGPTQRANRAGGLLMLGVAYWAVFEVLWNTASDPSAALWLFRLASPGFLFLAPLTADLVLSASERPWSNLNRGLPLLYGISTVLLVLTLATPWMVEDMHATSWGYAMVPGPLFSVWLFWTVASSSWALAGWIRDFRTSTAAVARTGPITAVGTFTTIVAASVTDGFLPVFGIQVPRFGTFFLTLLSAVILWSLNRYGYSMLSPAAFAHRMLQILPDGVVLTSLNGRIRLANDAMLALLGCSRHAALGSPISAFLGLPLLNPPREAKDLESELTPVSGRPIPVTVSATPLLDNEHAVMGLVLIVRDMREVTSLRTRLLTSGRLAAVGQLAAGIAHEINNPLAFVCSNLNQLRSQWLKFSTDLDKCEQTRDLREIAADWEELIDESLEGVNRAVMIVRDIRGFSHAGTEKSEMVDLGQLLDQVVRVAAPQLPAGARVEKHYGVQSPILCEPQRIKQLFLNLVVNAAQAIEEEGRIRVRSREIEDFALVSVEDDGCGIEPEAVGRIFDPFFTTKAIGIGTGLGLSISHEIVRRHGGSIEVDSKPGHGTAIRVRLPLADSGG